MIKPLVLAAALAASSSPVVAEELPIARVFAAPAINGPAPRGVQISPDGAFVTYLKPEPTDQTTFDLWARPIKGGEPKLLIEGSKVEPKGAVLTEAEKGRRERQRIAGNHGVTAYRWDETGDQILIPAAGKLYLASAKTGAVRKLGGAVFIDVKKNGEVYVNGAKSGQIRSSADVKKNIDAAPNSEITDASDAKISPKGGYVTYVKDQNLHALDLKTGSDRAITTQGKDALSFGTAEFVAQEEMDRFTGYWVSPDERLIAFTRVDESPVDIVPRVDIGVEGSTIVNQRYPRAGRPNAIVELYITPMNGGPKVKVDLGANTNIYLARVDWSKDGKTLYVQRESRDQTQLDLMAVDPNTGAAKTIIVEQRTPWINLNDDFTPLKDGTFVWGSERTGFHHLYLYKADGTLIRPITHGDWPLASTGGAGLHPSAVAHVDEAAGVLYFTASKESPTTRDLYAVSYRHAEEPRRITTGDGWWSAEVAKDGKSFVGGFSDPRTPPQTALYAIDGHRLGWIEENKLDAAHPIHPYLDHKSYAEYGTIQGWQGDTLYYSLTKPYNFDPKKHYPVVVSVYGGPGVGPTVTKTWPAATDQLLTQAGYIVFRLDNRGTSNRGLKFEAAIAGKLGGPEVEDQVAGQRFLSDLPYVDRRRIGVMGGSYGGYMTLRLLTEPEAGFRAGAAASPPTDWRLYDTHYTEHYMGDPAKNGAAYDASAILPRLKALAGPHAPRLLLVHGMADDNVVFENSTRAMAALQDQSIPFDLMLFPGQRHGVNVPAKQVQLWETYLAFFKRTLGGPE